MDKQNLYYVVIDGTNSRAKDASHCPIIFQPGVVEDFLEKENDTFAKHVYVKISVEEYERTFTEQLEY